MWFIIGILIGIFIGWLIPQPQWAIDLINKIKSKLHIGSS